MQNLFTATEGKKAKTVYFESGKWYNWYKFSYALRPSG